MGLNNFMRADGNPKLAMLTMFLGAGSNIVLDPIFIFVFHMGMAGAAYATILSQLVSTIWVIQYFLGKHSKNKLRLHYLKPNLSITKRIVSLGLPGFFLQLANSALNIVLNKSLQNYGGVIAINSMGIINSLQTLLLMPIIGLNQGIQPIISFNYGAKKYDRVKKTSYLAIIIATIIVIIGFIITRVFPNLLISLFNRDPELIEFGSFALKAWFLCLPVIGFQIIASNFFQAIGKSGSAMFLTLTRQVILLIPALLILPLFLGLNGILYAAPFADFFSFLLTGIWYYREMKKWGNNL
jgi:putative MATE family efflux protein